MPGPVFCTYHGQSNPSCPESGYIVRSATDNSDHLLIIHVQSTVRDPFDKVVPVLRCTASQNSQAWPDFVHQRLINLLQRLYTANAYGAFQRDILPREQLC